MHDRTLDSQKEGWPGLLDNDEDADFEVLRVSSYSLPQYGTVVVFEDGHFDYTPFPGATAETDSFTYTATDGVASVTGAVDLAIGNQAVMAVDGFYDLHEDQTLNADDPTLLRNDTDADDDVLRVTAVNDGSTAVGQPLTLAPGATPVVQADGRFT